MATAAATVKKAKSKARSPQDVILDIRRECSGSSLHMRQMHQNSLKIIAVSIYSKHSHFVFELLQNADDNFYSADVEPKLIFSLAVTDPSNCTNEEGALYVRNNEVGFTEANVRSMCNVGDSTKKGSDTLIGEKGIGMKSIFSVTETAFFSSSGYSFSLSEKVDPEIGIGYVVPTWVDSDISRGSKAAENTVICMPLKANQRSGVSTCLSEIKPETLLFLRKLRHIEINIEPRGHKSTALQLSISLELSTSETGLTTAALHILKDSVHATRRYFIFTKTVIRPVSLIEDARPGVKIRDISVAFALDRSSSKFVNENSNIFAYMPTEESALVGLLPCIVNADFLLVASRESIKHDSAWNSWLMSMLPSAFVEGFGLNLKSKPEGNFYAYTAIPHASVDDEESAEDEEGASLFGRIVPSILDLLSKDKIVQDLFGEWVLPTEVLMVDVKFYSLIERAGEPSEWWRTRKIPCPEAGQYFKRLKNVGVKRATPRNYARWLSKECFPTHVIQDNDWLQSLFEFLADLPHDENIDWECVRRWLPSDDIGPAEGLAEVYYFHLDGLDDLRSVLKKFELSVQTVRVSFTENASETVIQFLREEVHVKEATVANYVLATAVRAASMNLTTACVALTRYVAKYLSDFAAEDLINYKNFPLVLEDDSIQTCSVGFTTSVLLPRCVSDGKWPDILSVAEISKCSVVSDSYMKGLGGKQKSAKDKVETSSKLLVTFMKKIWAAGSWPSINLLKSVRSIKFDQPYLLSSHHGDVRTWKKFSDSVSLLPPLKKSPKKHRSISKLRVFDIERFDIFRSEIFEDEHALAFIRFFTQLDAESLRNAQRGTWKAEVTDVGTKNFSQSFESAFLQCARTKDWVPVQNGRRLAPSKVLIDSKELQENAGILYPFLAIADIPTELVASEHCRHVLGVLGLTNRLDSVHLLDLLRNMSSTGVPGDDRVVHRIYTLLNLSGSCLPTEESLVYVGQGRFAKLSQCVWGNIEGIPAFEKHVLIELYPSNLMPFFVERCGVNKHVGPEAAYRYWALLQSDTSIPFDHLVECMGCVFKFLEECLRQGRLNELSSLWSSSNTTYLPMKSSTGPTTDWVSVNYAVNVDDDILWDDTEGYLNGGICEVLTCVPSVACFCENAKGSVNLVLCPTLNSYRQLTNAIISHFKVLRVGVVISKRYDMGDRSIVGPRSILGVEVKEAFHDLLLYFVATTPGAVKNFSEQRGERRMLLAARETTARNLLCVFIFKHKGKTYEINVEKAAIWDGVTNSAVLHDAAAAGSNQKADLAREVAKHFSRDLAVASSIECSLHKLLSSTKQEIDKFVERQYATWSAANGGKGIGQRAYGIISATAVALHESPAAAKHHQMGISTQLVVSNESSSSSSLSSSSGQRECMLDTRDKDSEDEAGVDGSRHSKLAASTLTSKTKQRSAHGVRLIEKHDEKLPVEKVTGKRKKIGEKMIEPQPKSINERISDRGFELDSVALSRSHLLIAMRMVSFDSLVVTRRNMKSSRTEDETMKFSLCLGAVQCRSYGTKISNKTLEIDAGLTKGLCALVTTDPKYAGFFFSSIQINKNFQAPVHVDQNNVGRSLIIGFGDYTGGDLWVSGIGGHNCRDNLIEFDANLPHATLPFTGERYTVTYFLHNCHRYVRAEDEVILSALGFALPPSPEFSMPYPPKAERLEIALLEIERDSKLRGQLLLPAEGGVINAGETIAAEVGVSPGSLSLVSNAAYFYDEARRACTPRSARASAATLASSSGSSSRRSTRSLTALPRKKHLRWVDCGSHSSCTGPVLEEDADYCETCSSSVSTICGADFSDGSRSSKLPRS